MVKLDNQQATIVYIFNMEESTGKRHWEWDPEDPHIYMEWLNGTTILRNKIALENTLTKQQKVMNNNAPTEQQLNGNTNQPGPTGGGIGEGNQITNPLPTSAATAGGSYKTGSSGKVYDSKTSPHLFRGPRRKGHPRRG